MVEQESLLGGRVEPGQEKTGAKFSHTDGRLHGRFCYADENSELQICQGGLGFRRHSWEPGGPSKGPLCGLLPGGVLVFIAGYAVIAQLGRHDTAHLRTPLLYAPLRLPLPFEATKYHSFAAIARN